jgi:hypothetical protein
MKSFMISFDIHCFHWGVCWTRELISPTRHFIWFLTREINNESLITR